MSGNSAPSGRLKDQHEYFSSPGLTSMGSDAICTPCSGAASGSLALPPPPPPPPSPPELLEPVGSCPPQPTSNIERTAQVRARMLHLVQPRTLQRPAVFRKRRRR